MKSSVSRKAHKNPKSAPTPKPTSSADLTPRDLRLMALSILERTLRALLFMDDSGAVVRREAPPLLRLRDEEEQAADIRALVNQLRQDQPLTRSRLANTTQLVQAILDSNDLPGALQTVSEANAHAAQLLNKSNATGAHSVFEQTTANQNLRLTSSIELMDDIRRAHEREISEQRFVAAVMQMCSDYRNMGQAFAPDDELALEKAYQMLDAGVPLPRNYQPIVTGPSRKFQTYLSFADPGEGHLAVTVRRNELLYGLIVHIEYIDRDSIDSKDIVEAYRLPAIRNAARIRLHVGSATPCTAYVGRPVFEKENYKLGLLKAAHSTASICSALFAHGIADCKIAMDKLSASEAVDFMRAVAGNVIRDPITQRLSAAFNISTPVKDDLFSHGEPIIKDPVKIAELAVRLVKQGKFNKIAWDGASDQQPSRPFIGQISRRQLLELVHSAHERGLETYISAGMKSEHMRDAVFIGVGGVGIGTDLHYKQGNTIGEIDARKVVRALEEQQRASHEIGGWAAAVLAQLDWSYAEGSGSRELNKVRSKLFETLSALLHQWDELDQASASVNVPKGVPIDLEKQLTDVLMEVERLQAVPPAMDPDAAIPIGAVIERSDNSADNLVLQWAARVVRSSILFPSGNLIAPQKLESIRNSLAAHDIDALKQLYLA